MASIISRKMPADQRNSSMALGQRESRDSNLASRLPPDPAVPSGAAPPGTQQSPPQPVELGLRERSLAAGAAAVLSAVIMNPLDVAKTRLQAQAAGYTYAQGSPNAPCNNCGSPWPDPVTRRHLSSYQLEWLWGPLDHQGHRPPPRASMPVPSVAVAAAARAGAEGAAASCEIACDFPQPQPKAYRGPLDVFLRIIREEGPLRLWRGTNAGLLMAVPSVGIYMPVYDTLRARLEESGPHGEQPWTAPFAPLIAGSVSRSVACIMCAPLELARTRIQATSAKAQPEASVRSMQAQQNTLVVLRQAVEAEKLLLRRGRGGTGGTHSAAAPNSALAAVAPYRVLWRGVDAHMARDVPFSAVCWSILEPLRRALLALQALEAHAWSQSPRGAGEVMTAANGGPATCAGSDPGEVGLRGRPDPSLLGILAANFGAGVVAGSFAAALTTPLDVAKTRVQIEICSYTANQGVAYHLREIWREGGLRALYTGMGPRALKAGPSVGIIVSFYELLKALLSHAHRGN